MAERSPFYVYPPRPIIGNDSLTGEEFKEHIRQNSEMFLVRRGYYPILANHVGHTRALAIVTECRTEQELLDRWAEIRIAHYRDNPISEREITREARDHCRAYDRWAANGSVGTFRRNDGPLAAPPPESTP